MSDYRPWRARFELLATVAMTVAAVVVTWVALSKPRVQPRAAAELSLPQAPVSLSGASLLGDPAAPLALLVFSDFQCPYCSRFATTTFRSLAAEYVDSSKLLVAFWNFPLERIHPDARRAAEAAECAGRQGRFWQMHDGLFTDPKALGGDTIRERARVLGLDNARFEACVAGEASGDITADLEVGRALGVTATPAFFLGARQADGSVLVTQAIAGARPFEQFREVIDTELGSIRRR